jgi:hypothetical protein
MPSPIQIAIAIGLYDVIHMEAPVELGYEQRSASALVAVAGLGGALARMVLGCYYYVGSLRRAGVIDEGKPSAAGLVK